MNKPKLTIASAVYEDYDGIVFTLQSLRLYHDVEDCEFLVLDNSPDSEHGRETRNFCNSIQTRMNPVRYIPYAENAGTTQTRQRLFDHAEGDAVLVMDCHVLLAPNAIHNLKKWYAEADEAAGKNLYTGPLLMDSLMYQQSHFECEWRSEMWGTWATAWINPEGKYVVGRRWDFVEGDPTKPGKLELKFLNTDGPWMRADVSWINHEDFLVSKGYKIAGWGSDTTPFEVPGQGLGIFSARKDTWLGFNPDFRSFGGEECYIHEKYRQVGRKTLCLPFLKWWHRFGRPGGPKYPISREGKMRNYILGFQELGLDIEQVRHHFVDEIGVNPKMWELAMQDPKGYDPMNNALYRTPPNTFLHNQKPKAFSNNGLGLPLVQDDLNAIAFFLQSEEGKRDLEKHAPAMMRICMECDSVCEITKRRESTAFLLSGLTRAKSCKDAGCKEGCKGVCKTGATLVSYQEERDTLIDVLQDAVKTHRGQRSVSYTDIPVALDNPPAIEGEFDLLFLDTRHTRDRLAAELRAYSPHVKKFIAMHDTVSSGLKGDDGKPGLIFAIRDFIKANPEWYIMHHNTEQYGFTVLARVPGYEPANPIVIWPRADQEGLACGCGQSLKGYLKVLGIQAAEGCSCNARALEMDLWGPAKCRENIETILDWLKEEADKRNLGFTFVRSAVKLMVLRAIKAAEKDEQSGKCIT